MPSNVVKAVPIQTFDTLNITPQFQSIAGLPVECFYLRITNRSNLGITISFDGQYGHIFLMANQSWEMGSQTQSQPNNQVCLWQRYQQIYAASGDGAAAGEIIVQALYI